MSSRTPRPGPDEDDAQPFLQRWSRLKTEARAGESAGVEPTARAVIEPGADAPPASEAPSELPDIDQLDQDSDYSAFLAPGIDPLLRRLALRKLFRSPKFNVCDGLDDYCDDFTRFAPLGETVTADMRHQLERAARQALSAVEDAAAEADPSPGVPDRHDTPGASIDDTGETGADDAGAEPA
jgi:hypothetical protein